MIFDLTEGQQVIQKAVTDFANGEFDEDLILELQQRKEFPHEILKISPF